MRTGVVMTEPTDPAVDILATLDGVDELRPAEELATYEHVLAAMTELLNAPEEHSPGAA